MLRRIAQQERCIANIAKQSEEARAEWIEIDAKCTDLDLQMEKAVAEAAKIKEEQIYLFDVQREEATKRDVAPAGHFGAVGGGTHGHPVQLDVSTSCQFLAQAIHQQYPPEESAVLLAMLQRLDLHGLVPAGRQWGKLGSAEARPQWGSSAPMGEASGVVPVAPVATSPAAPGATGMAAEAERWQLEAALAGGKGGKGKGDSFQPYEKGSETPGPGGKDDDNL